MDLSEPPAHQSGQQPTLEILFVLPISNGGGDSQDTANKLAQFNILEDFPITCIGIPKTVDNDLPMTDNYPGFGSDAK